MDKKYEEKKNIRNEELWEMKVAEAVRIKVLKEAGSLFAMRANLAEAGSRFLPQLISKLWSTSSQGEHAITKTKVIRDILSATDEKAFKSASFSAWGGLDPSDIAEWGEATQYLVLFLFVHGNKGCMQYSNYCSQKEVRELADEYAINYKLVDAQTRLELAPKKYKDEHETYLRLVEVDAKNALIPRVYSDKFETGDEED
jgi:hypothetical protein